MGTGFHGANACSDACFRTRRTDTAISLDYAHLQRIARHHDIVHRPGAVLEAGRNRGYNLLRAAGRRGESVVSRAPRGP